MRDFLSFRTWQHQKRSNFERRPQFLNLTTSKTKQFCETSSNFRSWQHQTRSDFLRKWKVECGADGLVQMRFAIFPVHVNVSKVLRLPQQSEARSYEVLHLSRKIILITKPDDLMLQNATHLRKSSPWPPKISGEHVSCNSACHAKCIFANPLQMPHACQRFWNCYSYKTLTFCSLLARCRIPCACHAKPDPNFQKWSETVSVLRFSLPYVLRATTACTFSTSQLPKVFRHLNFQKCSEH